MSPGPADAKNRATVWVNSAGKWGTLMYVHTTAERAKVRLACGAHIKVPCSDVELYTEPG